MNENRKLRNDLVEALKITDDCIYEIEDKISIELIDELGLRRATKHLYQSFYLARIFIENSKVLTDEDKEYLIKTFNLEEALPQFTEQ